jgi:predicted RNase H-like nuclease (RuvC/YqgF family)
MNEALKNRIVIILAILSVVFFFGTLSSCSSAIRQKAARDKEMVARLALEEKTSKYAQEKSALEEKARAKENQVQELKASLETAKKALVQDQLVSQSLKEELQKVTKLKETLEEELRQALVNGTKTKK